MSSSATGLPSSGKSHFDAFCRLNYKVCMAHIFVRLHVFDSTQASVFCCVISCDIHLLVAARILASLNFRNRDFSFVLPKYRAIVPRNVARNIV